MRLARGPRSCGIVLGLDQGVEPFFGSKVLKGN